MPRPSVSHAGRRRAYLNRTRTAIAVAALSTAAMLGVGSGAAAVGSAPSADPTIAADPSPQSATTASPKSTGRIAPGRAPAATSKVAAAVRAKANRAVNTDPLIVEIHEISPTIPERGSIEISGEVTNTTADVWTTVNLHVFNSQFPMVDSTALSAAASLEASEYVGDRITVPGTFDTVPQLNPGVTAPFSVKVPVSQLSISGEPGVYWIGIHAFGDSVTARDGFADGKARTFIPLVTGADKPKSLDPVDAAVVVALRANVWHRADGRIDHPDRWSRWLAADGRLSRLLDVASTSDVEVSWLVDPAALAAITRLSRGNPPRNLDPVPEVTPPPETPAEPVEGTESVDPVTAVVTPISPSFPEGTELSAAESRVSEQANQWLARFREVTQDADVLALPYGDLDVAAAARRSPETIQFALDRGQQVMAQLGIPAQPTISPRSGLLPPTAFGAIPEGTLVLLSDTAFTVPPDTAGVATIAERSVVLTTSSASAGGPSPTDPSQTLALRQRLISEAALRRQGDDPAPVVLMLAPSWSGEDADSLVDGLAQPWLDIVAVSEIVAAVPTPLAPTDLAYTASDQTSELPEYVFARGTRLIDTADLLGSVLADVTTAAGQLHDEALVGLSEGRRVTPQESGFAMTSTANQVQDLLASITVEAPRAVTLTSASGTVGATLTNGMDQPVTVRLSAESDGSLTLSNEEELTLAPETRKRILLDVSTTREGRHDVQLQVTAVDGQPLGATADLPIRSSIVSQAVWVAMMGAVVLLFLVVTFRIIRRIRRVRAGEPVRPPLPPEPTSTPEAPPA